MDARISEAHRGSPALGVLLVNLGTPDAPEAGAIRRYLREFLSDRRVVDVSPLLWLPLLYGIILPLRPRRLAHAYASIWTAHGSPLLATTQALAAAVGQRLRNTLGDNVRVAVGMRYGSPSIAAAIDELRAAHARRIVVLPLYPQYASSTTGTAYDAVFAQLRTLTWIPELHGIGAYHDHPGYIGALADSVRAHWAAQGRGDHLLMSFHGIPQRHVMAGDPYYCHCQKTARLLAAALQLEEGHWTVAFQSRFGRIPWIRPYTDEVLSQLAARGVRRLDTICPGFAADCLETLEEVAIRYRQAFAASGGDLRYIPALNDSPAHADALARLVTEHAAHWRPAPLADGDRQLREARAAARLPQFGAP